MPSLRFRRHFVPWDRPWLPQAAAWLARDWNGSGPLDLANVLAVVPTRHSARRLREALAEHAAERNAAVFPPRTHTPDTLLTSGFAVENVASRLEALLAWTDVLRTTDLEATPDVFPAPPARRDAGWAGRLAENFFRLQTQLAESGLGFAAVNGLAGDDFPERERWRQLAQLEQAQAAALAAAGLREPHAVRLEFARAPVVPEGIERIVVLAVPDPLPLALEVLKAWAEHVPVEIVVFAAPGEADAFDLLGRPVPAAWERRIIGLPDFASRVHLCADPAEEAARAAALVRRYTEPDGRVALGLPDPDVLPLLENELSRRAVQHYNPEGRVRRSERFHALLSALAALAREPSFEAVARLARCPDVLSCLAGEAGREFSAARFLSELDQLHARHLPADLAAARAVAHPDFPHAARGLEAIAGLQSALAGAFPGAAFDALGRIFASRRFDLKRPDEARLVAAAEAWRDVTTQCAAAQARFPALETAEWWDLALRIFGESRHTEEKPSGALELQGWLELLWEDAPHLVAVGLNDGLVPDAIVGDPFLPESLRQKLGLKTNAARFARDAYLLQAVVAARLRDGRIDLLFAKNSAAGDPLRPSRLLLRCADAELPERIAFLFRPAEALQPNLPWTRAWKLQPPARPAPTRVPVTSLRAWLACPFRFYLRHVLKMEPVDPQKSEMDALDFGTLCHAALEAMAREPALRDCVDEKTLREFLLAEFDRAARARFGGRLTLPLVVQCESARQRLARLATVQARERAAGWTIERVESSFTLDVGGLQVRGKIDRIDHHAPSGAWRVLDYKTSDIATSPHKSHLRPFRPGDERLPEWMSVRVGPREMVWADLQLPVYLRALAGELPGPVQIAGGYVNLPKATGETALALWHELTPELLDAARACTDGVAARILAGDFWPPAEVEPDRDPFAALFHQGAEMSVDKPPSARPPPEQAPALASGWTEELPLGPDKHANANPP